MGSVSPADARVEGTALRVVRQAAEILWEWWWDWRAIGWDSSIAIDTARYRRWLCAGKFLSPSFSCEIRVAGPYRITFRGLVAEKSLPNLRHRGGYYLLATFRKPSPQGPPHKLTVVVSDELSIQEQKRWRKRVKYESNAPGEPLPHTWLITAFRKHAARRPDERKVAREQLRQDFPEAARRLEATASRFGHGPEDAFREYWRGDFCGWRQVYANRKTTPDDIMAHCLLLLWREDMLEWDVVAPSLQHYGSELTDLILRTPTVALPLQANALWPAGPTLERPDSLSVKAAAARLGITRRQLMYQDEQGRIRLDRSNPHSFRVPLTDAERLENDPQFQHARKREEYRRKGQARGLTSENLRQRRRRGPRKPDNTPDWEALNADLQRKPARCRSRTDETPAPSLASYTREELEDLHAELQRRIAKAETEDESLHLMDNRREVERMLKQPDRLEPGA
jgi:hypothetical protein